MSVSIWFEFQLSIMPISVYRYSLIDRTIRSLNRPHPSPNSFPSRSGAARRDTALLCIRVSLHRVVLSSIGIDVRGVRCCFGCGCRTQRRTWPAPSRFVSYSSSHWPTRFTPRNAWWVRIWLSLIIRNPDRPFAANVASRTSTARP